MAVDNTRDIVTKEVEKINAEAKINEAYFVGLLWADPFNGYSEYGDSIAQDEFIHDVWGFYYELGRKMYEEGVQTFDDITVMTKVKEYNVEDDFSIWGGLDQVEDAVNIVASYTDNIEYYFEATKKNYVVRQLYQLFGDKVLINRGRYNWNNMNREQLTKYWGDQINQISLDNVSRYESENLYIDAEEFIHRLETESADVLPYFNSNMLNSISQGVPRGHVTMLGGFGGHGKSILMDEDLPTPTGWRKAKDVKVGDKLFDRKGEPTTVLGVFPQGVLKAYDVTLDDGRVFTVNDEHLVPYLAKHGSILNKPLKDMMDDYIDEDTQEYKYKIPRNLAVDYVEKDFPVDPYTLGVLFGGALNADGTKQMSELYMNELVTSGIEDADMVSMEELITEDHLVEGSIHQREQVLMGLLDISGHTITRSCKGKEYIFETMSEYLQKYVALLARSMGYSAVTKESEIKHNNENSYSVYIDTCGKHPYIVDISESGEGDMVCFKVDNDESLFLMNDYIVTHNTSLMAEKFVMSCIANGERAIIVLNEEDAQSFRQKIVLSILYHEFHTGIDRRRMVNGKLSEKDKDKIRKAFARMRELMDGEEAQIKVIFMEEYDMADLEKIVRFWSNRGYINLVIDTHKPSDNSPHDARWEVFTEDAKTIYRWTRANAGGMNLRTLITVQLADSAINNRFLDYDAIGEGKKAKNEASVMYMFRGVWSDEYEGEKRALDCYRLRKNQKTGEFEKEFFQLDKDTTYYLFFTAKNRFGQSNENGQPVLVLEPMFNANAFKEIGWTFVPQERAGR